MRPGSPGPVYESSLTGICSSPACHAPSALLRHIWTLAVATSRLSFRLNPLVSVAGTSRSSRFRWRCYCWSVVKRRPGLPTLRPFSQDLLQMESQVQESRWEWSMRLAPRTSSLSEGHASHGHLQDSVLARALGAQTWSIRRSSIARRSWSWAPLRALRPPRVALGREEWWATQCTIHGLRDAGRRRPCASEQMVDSPGNSKRIAAATQELARALLRKCSGALERLDTVTHR